MDIVSKNRAGAFWKQYNTFFILIVIVIASSLMSNKFFTATNVPVLMRQIAPVGITSIGMLIVVCMGGIDLSVGSIMAVGCVLGAPIINQTGSISFCVAVVLVTGLVLGAVSGYFIAFMNIAPFVMTLAMMTIATGISYIYSKARPVQFTDRRFSDFIQSYFFGIPTPVIFMIVICIIAYCMFRYTLMGRMFLAIGSNEESVRLSGINVRKYKFIGYAISGVLSAWCGLMMAGRTNVSSPLVGNGAEMDAIAAVVIGGASLAGGRGSVPNTLMGAIILGIISNIMNLMNIPAYPQNVVKGVIIILAVVIQQFDKKK
jgi:ribose transport system permease protein